MTCRHRQEVHCAFDDLGKQSKYEHGLTMKQLLTIIIPINLLKSETILVQNPGLFSLLLMKEGAADNDDTEDDADRFSAAFAASCADRVTFH